MKIALLAEQNFNLIDGSTIWLLNTCKLLSMQRDFDVDLLLSQPLITDVLTRELPANINVTDATQLGSGPLHAATLAGNLANWEETVGVYDRIMVRGDDFLAALMQDTSFQKRVVAYAPGIVPDVRHANPDWVDQAREHRTVTIVQSVPAKRVMESLLDYPASCVHVVPPVTFVRKGATDKSTGTATLCYSGKIDPEYGLSWLLDICDEINNEPDVEIDLIAGKDTLRAKYPDFFEKWDHLRDEIRRGERPTLSLFESVPHTEAQGRMSRADFAFCLRDGGYDDGLEISTKVVEFCALGVPPILNDTALNRDLFGADYPYFVDTSIEDVPSVVQGYIRDCDSPAYHLATLRILEISKRFAPEVLSKRLAGAIRGSDRIFRCRQHVKILISTHDPKFLHGFTDRLQAMLQVSVAWEHWRSTQERGNEKTTPKPVDVVFCEWCCGNAVWHSHNKPAGTKLIVRLHRFEAFRDFPDRVQWGNVDALIVVSDWFRDQMVHRYGVDPTKVHVIPQFIDHQELSRPKLEGARHMLGLVGINPFDHKRFDRAIDFLEAIRAIDPRFQLTVRSTMPWEIPWVWNREDGSRAQFESQFERVFNDPELSSAIRFDPAGPDMEEWYRGIGTILSSSESEGCHTAVIEGMASGCLPVVRDWPGARGLFGPYVYPELTDAVQHVLSFSKQRNIGHEQQSISNEVSRFDVMEFTDAFLKLCDADHSRLRTQAA
ncbi:MAG: glycosyltransferase family 4 protein [Paracoccaceae bacterium]